MKKILLLCLLSLSGCVVTDPYYVQSVQYSPVYVPGSPIAIYEQPVYNYNAHRNVRCVYPYSPSYANFYIRDQYGNRAVREKFVGCR